MCNYEEMFSKIYKEVTGDDIDITKFNLASKYNESYYVERVLKEYGERKIEELNQIKHQTGWFNGDRHLIDYFKKLRAQLHLFDRSCVYYTVQLVSNWIQYQTPYPYDMYSLLQCLVDVPYETKKKLIESFGEAIAEQWIETLDWHVIDVDVDFKIEEQKDFCIEFNKYLRCMTRAIITPDYEERSLLHTEINELYKSINNRSQALFVQCLLNRDCCKLLVIPEFIKLEK